MLYYFENEFCRWIVSSVTPSRIILNNVMFLYVFTSRYRELQILKLYYIWSIPTISTCSFTTSWGWAMKRTLVRQDILAILLIVWQKASSSYHKITANFTPLEYFIFKTSWIFWNLQHLENLTIFNTSVTCYLSKLIFIS